MNRRQFLTDVRAAAGVSIAATSIAGCSASEPSGRTYVLEMAASETTDGTALDFDTTGLTTGQREILEAAIDSGSYAERNVNWSTLPAREPITAEFRSVVQLVARHVDRDPAVTEPTAFDTPARYEDEPYLVAIDVQ